MLFLDLLISTLSTDIRVHRDGSQLKTIAIFGNKQTRDGKRYQIYTSAFFRIQKFTPKVCDSRQIQCYPKCTICVKFCTKKVKKKQCKTPGNSVKQSQTQTLMVSRSPAVFTPLFITFSTKCFTPVGNFLHQQRLYRLYLIPSVNNHCLFRLSSPAKQP